MFLAGKFMSIFLAIALMCAIAVAAGQHLRLVRLRESLDRIEGENRRLRFGNQRLEEEVERLRLEAETDSLTGVLNRRAFERALQKEQARAARNEGVLVYFALDLDRFKGVNDTFGHPKGDEVLCAVAFALRNASRAYDLVCRLGGDEFVLVFALAEYDETFVLQRREQLRAAIWNLTLAQAGVAVAATIGIGLSLAQADANLYLNKPGEDDTVIRED